MATTWKQKFFTQLAAKARDDKSFIYNPDKVIVAGTIRLEMRVPLLTHTAWNLDEKQASLVFYSANPATEATEIPENNRRFMRLFEHKAAINKAFGEPLDWNYDEGRKHQKVIARAYTKATEINRKVWPKIQADLIGRAQRLSTALKPYLAVLDDPPAMKRLDARQAEPKSAVPVRPKPVVSPPTKPPRKTVRQPRPVLEKQPAFDPDDLKI